MCEIGKFSEEERISNTTQGMLISFGGNLFNWDPFFRPLVDNYNMLVLGPAGCGKAVFLKELITCMLSQDVKVFVLDVKQEFKHFTRILNGEILSNISCNPFSKISELSNKKSDFSVVIDMATKMIKSIVNIDSELQKALLEIAIRKAIKKFKTPISITKIAKCLKKIGNEEAIKMGLSLVPYTLKGENGKYFHKNDITYDNQLTVFQFEDLEQDEKLLHFAMQMVSMQILSQMLVGDQKTRFMIIITDDNYIFTKYSAEFFFYLARVIKPYCGSLVVSGSPSNKTFQTDDSVIISFNFIENKLKEGKSMDEAAESLMNNKYGVTQ